MSDAAVSVLKRFTNRRQAAKIRSVETPTCLHATLTDGRDFYIQGVDDGLYAVGYGSGGGLYIAGVLAPMTVRAQLQAAESIRVIHDRDALPTAVRDPAEDDDA